MAIRSRIIAVVLALVFLALLILDGVSYSFVKNSLLSNADNQMTVAWNRFWRAMSSPAATSPPFLCDGLPNDSFGALYYMNGKATDLHPTCSARGGTVQLPTLPASLLSSASSASPAGNPGPQPTFFVSADGFRLAAAVETVYSPSSASSLQVLYVLGEPLGPISSTLDRVLLLELVVTGSILIVAGVAAYFLVQLGLRPLEKMADTAGEIAAGDLSRRVAETDERTEVGKLGSALNTMLNTIEQAFKDKEASESRLRRFVADASHELRTPLTSIRGYAELFGNGRPARPEDLAAALKRIESESARMSGLVDDLLLLARLDQGRPLDHEPVDLGAIMRDAAHDARVLAPDRPISVEAGEQLRAIGDDARLRQVVTNLVANALAYTPPGSPVELRAARLGSEVRLAVADHGPGIPPEARSKIFDRFWRADESRQRAKGGAGLGLSLVSAIVSAHHGRVAVEETPGGGATFVVELPAFASEVGPRYRPLGPVEGPQAPGPAGSGPPPEGPQAVAWVQPVRPE